MSGMQCKHGINGAWCSICHPAATVDSISKFEAKHPELDVQKLADLYLTYLNDAQRTELLVYLLNRDFTMTRRRRVHGVEVSSTVAGSTKVNHQARHRIQKRYQKRVSEEAKAHRDDPWHAPTSSWIYKKWDSQSEAIKNRQRSLAEPRFAEFLKDNTKISGIDYSSWTLNQAFATAAKAMKEQAILELSEEFLASTFVVNGEIVKWGEATAEQHSDRAMHMLSYAEGSLETAKRHQAAIVLLHKHHSKTLNQVYEMETVLA